MKNGVCRFRISSQLRKDRIEFRVRRVIYRLQKSVKRLRLPAKYQLEIRI